MSEKRRNLLFSLVILVGTAAVFFALGFGAAVNYGFAKKRVVVDTILTDDTTNATAFAGQIDLNKATIEDLVKIEGIGEKTAQNIIDYREKIGGFQYVEQLLYVDGIGETKYNKWLPYFTVSGVTTADCTTLTSGSATDIRTTSTAFTGKFNLNTVTLEELMTISGVGEKTAKNILNYRDEIGGFTSLEQLMEIEGIGSKRFALLCEYLTLDD